MNNNHAKLAIITSILIHFVLFVFVIMISHSSYLPDKFIVLGAHSKVVTHAYYKSIQITNPSLQQPSQTSKKVSIPKKTVIKQTAKSPSIQKSKKVSVEKNEKNTQKNHATTIENEKKTIKNPQVKKIAAKKTTSAITQEELENDLNDDYDEFDQEDDDNENEKSPEQSKKLDKSNESPQQNTDYKQLSSNLSVYNQNYNINVHNKELMRYQIAIQQAVCDVWEPSPGIQKGTECTLRFVINNEGMVKHFEFIKHSNVLLFDLSIQRSAAKINFGKFDKNLCNKQIIIAFRE